MTGLPKDIDQDDVYGFFENARFGGGEIAKLERKDGVTFITFKDEAGALRTAVVISKMTMMMTTISPLIIHKFRCSLDYLK